jgi:hypothetical protein
VKGSIRIYTEWKKDTEANGNPNMLADYCCTLVRETPIDEYRRQKTTK